MHGTGSGRNDWDRAGSQLPGPVRNSARDRIMVIPEQGRMSSLRHGRTRTTHGSIAVRKYLLDHCSRAPWSFLIIFFLSVRLNLLYLSAPVSLPCLPCVTRYSSPKAAAPVLRSVTFLSQYILAKTYNSNGMGKCSQDLFTRYGPGASTREGLR